MGVLESETVGVPLPVPDAVYVAVADCVLVRVLVNEEDAVPV